jgi:hypothetical protein
MPPMPTCNIILQAQALFNLFGNEKKEKKDMIANILKM